MSAFRITSIVLCLILCVHSTTEAQSRISYQDTSKSHSGKKVLRNSSTIFAKIPYQQQRLDSLQLTNKYLSTPGATLKVIQNNRVALALSGAKKVVQIQGGYINYTYSFRSGIDTPFLEKNIGQHLLSSRLNVTVGNYLPLIVTYLERESNSSVYRDIRDVQVEFSRQAFQQIQTKALRQRLQSLLSQWRNPITKPAMEASLQQIDSLTVWLTDPAVQRKYIQSKELLLAQDSMEAVSFIQDSSAIGAKNFLALHDSIYNQKTNYKNLYDSLQQVYIVTEKKAQAMQRLMNSDLLNADNLRAIEAMLQMEGIEDDPLLKMAGAASAIRTFAIGKTTPNFSPLTLKSTNVRGLNFEYNRNHIYMALAAGRVDFRVRDFVYKGQRQVPQVVYAARIGYGEKEGSHFILTYYQGKKQFYSGNSSLAQPIRGLSFAAQWMPAKYQLLSVEFAQSANLLNVQKDKKHVPAFNFNEANNRAYSLQLKSFIPATKTKLDASYQHSGVNFQSFAAYRVNAALSSWSIRGEQYLWNKKLQLVAALRTNDFSNPLILQRYNANTVFKNFTTTFRKRGLPVLTIGYLPSSQYTVVDSQVYEHHYQVLNSSLNHSYKVGLANASTALLYNRFYNDTHDTGFVYYNANNYFLAQSFQFNAYTINANLSHTENGQYNLDVLEGGVTLKVVRQNAIGFGVKLNKLNIEPNLRLGVYGQIKLSVSSLGELNVWLEQNYLPNSKQRLTKNEFLTIGFTRSFN